MLGLRPDGDAGTYGEWGRTAGSKLGWLIAGRLATALLLSVVGTLWTRAGDPSQSINKSLGLLNDRRLPHDFLRTHLSSLKKHSLPGEVPTRSRRSARHLAGLEFQRHPVALRRALHRHHRRISSLFLGPREAVVTSVGCAVAFTACALQITGLAGQIDPTRLVRRLISQTVQWVGLFDVAFLVVGLLSARSGGTTITLRRASARGNAVAGQPARAARTNRGVDSFRAGDHRS